MRRLFTWLMLAFTLVVLVATLTRTVSLTLSLYQSEQSNALDQAREDARAIAAWAGERWERPPAEIRFSLGMLARVADARTWLVSSEGVVVVDSQGNPSWEGAIVSSDELARALKGEEVVAYGRSPWLESATALVLPVRLKTGQIVGAAFVFVPVQLNQTRAYTGPLIWSAVFAISVAALVAYLIARKLSAPVEAITHFARTMGEGQSTGGVSVRSITELNELAATLSHVSGQLRTNFDALREERQRLGAILESMQEGVLAIDQEGAVTLVNPAAIRLMGLPEGMPPQGVVVPNLLRAALCEAAAGETKETLLRLPGSDEALAICSPVPGTGGNQGGAVAVFRDLSSMMRLQRLRENFIADVAHELRGPLANLSILAEAFGDGVIAWEDRDPYIRSLQDEVAHLGRLSKDVLDLAQLDAGVMSVQLEPVLLDAVVGAVVSRLRGKAHAAAVELRTAVPLGLHVQASYLRLEQVLINLVENAIRHTGTGGTVTISAYQDEAQVCIRVTDTGVGIAPEHLPHIFDRFYKVDPARTRNDSGTGLGLAVVRQLVALQGGHVAIRSEEGVGTEMQVCLPAIAMLETATSQE